jgi:hypothetical protein
MTAKDKVTSADAVKLQTTKQAAEGTKPDEGKQAPNWRKGVFSTATDESSYADE